MQALLSTNKICQHRVTVHVFVNDPLLQQKVSWTCADYIMVIITIM